MFERFMLAARKVQWLSAAFSIASAWIWSPALFVSSQIAAERGLGGLLWFVLPNAFALVFFGLIARPIIEKYRNGFTLVNFMQQEYGTRTRMLYLIMMAGIQICAVAIQILGAGQALEMVSGIRYEVLVPVLGLVFWLVASINGLRVVLIINFLHIIALILVGVFAMRNMGSFNLSWGPRDTFVDFGLQSTLVLLAGPLADQQYWQRAFALKDSKNMRRSFALAGLLFAIVPMTFGVLGLAARTHDISGDMTTIHMLGDSIVKPGIVSILTLALIASGSNAVLAFGNIIGDTLLQQNTKRTLIYMSLCAVAGATLAMLRPRIIDLWLFYGSVRASVMTITIMAARGIHIKERILLRAVLASVVVGLLVYVFDSLAGVITMTFLPIVLTIGGRNDTHRLS